MAMADNWTWAEDKGIIIAQKGEEVKNEEEKKKKKKYELKEVKVKAEKEETPVNNPLMPAPSSRMTTTTITKEEIEAQNAKTVVEALDVVPGADIRSCNGKIKKFLYLRGERGHILINGSSADVQDQRSLFSLPAANVEKIEVIRNSSTLIYGPSGLGGVVNIITKEPEELTTTFTVEGGTNHTQFYRGEIGDRILDGKLGFYLSAQKDRTHGRSGNNAFNDMANFNGRLSFYFDDGSRATLNLNRDEGHFEGSNSQNYLQTRRGWCSSVIFDHWRTTMANATIIKKWGENISTYINPYYSRRTTDQSWKLGGDKVFVEDSSWGVNLRQTFKLFDINTLRVGGQYDHWLAPHGKLYYVGTRNDTERYAGFLQDEISFFDGKLELDGGVRWEQRYKNRFGAYWGRKVSYEDVWDKHFVNYSLGMVYHFTPKFSSSFRYGKGTLPHGNRLTRSGEMVEDEERKKYDLGFEYHWSRLLTTRLNFFWIDQKDAIESVGTMPVHELI
jgi:Outer membrane cobalamin receptor protein